VPGGSFAERWKPRRRVHLLDGCANSSTEVNIVEE
jgi:hypothetical protein